MINVTTFGKTPACMYLAQYLSDRGDTATARKISKALSAFRSTLKDIVFSHINGADMSAKTVARLVNILAADTKSRVFIAADAHADALLKNIMLGELKEWKNRAVVTSRLQQEVHRQTPAGASPNRVKILPRAGELTTAEKVKQLQERSRRYLQRKNKRNTLY